MTPLEGLQAALAAEHAAVHVFAVLGGRISASAEPDEAAALRAAYDVHRSRRDQLRGLVAGLGEVPVPAAPAYRVEAHDRDADVLVPVARETEERCAAVYAQLVAAAAGAERRWAVDALLDSAVRVLGFGARPRAYPGCPEL